MRARTPRPAAESRERASPGTNAPAGRASRNSPRIVRKRTKSDRATRPPPSRRVTLTTLAPSRPLPSLRDAIAAVEIDFGGGLFERIEVTLDDDPVAVAREFCQAKGFSLTISIPLAVKLAQARDKARRRARAARLGRPATAKPAMTSTLTAKARAKLDKLKASRPASASHAATKFDRDARRPPPLYYDRNKQFHSDADLEFGKDERVFGRTGALGDASALAKRGEDRSARRSFLGVGAEKETKEDREARLRELEKTAIAARERSAKRFIFGGGPGKQSKERAEREAARLREIEKARAKRTREIQLRRQASEGKPPPRDASDRKLYEEVSREADKSGEVFDKLYSNAVQKKERLEQLQKMKKQAEDAADAEARKARTKVMSKVSREMMQNRTAGEYSSYNERLYAEAAQRAEAKKIAQQRAREEKERAELEEITGAPNISHYSHTLVRPEAAWDRLSEGYAEKFKTLAQIKKDMEKKELSECTFRPKINDRSKSMMRGRVEALRDRGLSHHEQLYFDANRRQMRQEEFESWQPADHTFHPNAHRAAANEDDDEEGVPGEPKEWRPPKVNHDLVVQRLVASKAVSEQHKARLEEEMYGKLGQPNVGRAPAVDRNPGALPIHEVLYANRHEFDDKKELIRMRDDARLREEAAAAKVSSRSEGLFGALKRRKFRKIFAALDPEDSGLVDLRTVDLSRLENLGRVGAFDSPGSSPMTTPAPPSTDPSQASGLGGFGGGWDTPAGAETATAGVSSDPRVKEIAADVRAAAARCTAPVAVDGFIAAMEWVLSRDKTGPRSYLAPGAGRVSKAEKAAAAARAVERTAMHIQRDSPARVRTEKLYEKRQRKLGVRGSAPIYEKLIAEGRRNEQKLQALAKQLEEEALAECTFQPAMRKSADPYRTKGSRRAGDDVAGSAEALEFLAGSPGAPVPAPEAKLTQGEQRFADMEKELEMLAVGAHGGLGGNAEDLVRQLEEKKKSGPKSPLAALAESSDDEAEGGLPPL